MASFYPTSSAQIDVLSTPCIEDQKFTTFSGAPILHGNMMMYLNSSSSAGAISEISPGTSIAAQNNCVDIPSVTGRNEVMFIPPTGDSMCIQAISGQLNTATTDAVPNSVPEELHMTSRSQLSMIDGEQNLHGLSLSLSTQMSNTVPAPSFQHRFSNPPGLSPVLNCHVSLSGENICRSLSDKVEDESHSKDLPNTAYGSYDLYGEGANSVRFGTPNNLLFSANPKAVGYSSYQYEQAGIASTILKSKYLRAAQMLLDEVVNVRDALKQHESAKDQNNINKVEDGSLELKEKSVPGSEANESATISAPELSPTERQDLQNKLDKLLAMLDEVDRRYKQYYHQMQILVSSFDLVAGSGAAKPYTTLALKTISRHFRCLRDAISEQIQATRKSLGEVDSGQGGVIPRLRYIDQQLRQQRALQQFGMMRHAWRPQRGLPENAVTVLRAWLFEHFLHPYPKDSEKIMLARQTGLTRSQVANWFINARVRLWKPMVEEMYKEEFSKGDLPNPKSPDNMTRALGERSWASEDRREDLQESISSMADDSRHIQEDPNTGRAGMIGPHGGEGKQRRMLMKLQQDHHQPSLDGHGYYPHDAGLMVAASAYQFPTGMGSYGVDNQVSLALGLRHMDREVGPLSSAGVTFRESETVENSMVPETTGYSSYIDSVNQQQHRFGSSHLLNDFVA